ncbi:MAG: hypothetical protein CO064_08565 [Anaerolineae bacterium CG_4_9_14_0_8_um_filter_58_9]|nr:MAG: hypothetical protein CO064_08565 [Anaerolineae bacterium CG_4_9_14_0_8_um_filter_58_9]
MILIGDDGVLGTCCASFQNPISHIKAIYININTMLKRFKVDDFIVAMQSMAWNDVIDLYQEISIKIGWRQSHGCLHPG